MKQNVQGASGNHFLKRIAILYTVPLLLFIVAVGVGNYALFFLQDEIKEPVMLIVSLAIMIGTFTLLLGKTKKTKNK
jgi:positive regulator of sigma E activity